MPAAFTLTLNPSPIKGEGLSVLRNPACLPFFHWWEKGPGDEGGIGKPDVVISI